MFCGKCGKEQPEGATFCRYCGAPLRSTPKPTNYGADTSRLLYESKGGQGPIGIAVLVIGILVILYGILLVWLGSSTDAQRELMHGRLEDPKRTLVFALVFMFGGLCILEIGEGLMSCWTKIYSDRIEAQAFSIFGAKNMKVQLYVNQIDSVQIHGYFLNVLSGGKTIRLLCKDNEVAFQYINYIIQH